MGIEEAREIRKNDNRELLDVMEGASETFGSLCQRINSNEKVINKWNSLKSEYIGEDKWNEIRKLIIGCHGEDLWCAEGELFLRFHNLDEMLKIYAEKFN